MTSVSSPTLLAPHEILSGISDDLWKPAAHHPGVFTLEMDREKVASLSGIRLTKLDRFLALTRKNPWFIEPVWGNSESDVPPTECQLLLWRRTDGLWAAFVTTAHGNHRAWLASTPDGLALQTRGQLHAGEPGQLCLGAIATGKNPTALLQSILDAAMERIRVAKPRRDKPAPEWVNGLGWCTWDAFYHDVNASKIETSLEAFQRDGITIPVLIVDDGWQQYRDGQLLAFAADPAKFPEGLSGLSKTVKAKFGVRLLGVWHALAGYWNGVHAQGELAGLYRLCPSFHGAYNVPNGKDLLRSLVHPEDIHRFYQDFHKFLRSEGIDMVKIDNQSSLDHFTENMLPDVRTMAEYQNAIQGSTAVHFGNNLLHCMAMSNDVAWNLTNSAVWRNSQDYFPKKPESHGFHLVANAANALWSSHFALPDWDMFHSGGEAGWFHGAARAISGGPVYISDEPGKYDPALLKALSLSQGRVARPPFPAQVADSRILVDCSTEDRLLAVRNQTTTGFLLGLFHCKHSESAAAIADSWSPSDANATGQVVVRGFRSGQCEVLYAAESRKIELLPLGWEILTIAPIRNGIALLGLDGKLAGAAAITGADFINERLTRVHLLEGGELRLWSREQLVVSDVLGNALPIHAASDNTWVVSISVGSPATILIERAVV